MKFSNYEGPASIVSYLTKLAQEKAIKMATLVAEIPAYVQGRNPKCIEAVVRRLAHLLAIEIDVEDLRRVSDELERKLDKVVQDRPELAQHIRMLEENYDAEVFDTELGDLKDWLIQQGIRLD